MNDSRRTFIVDKSIAGHWRVTLDNPPINVIDDGMYDALYDLVGEIEADAALKVVTFEAPIPIFLSRTTARPDRAAALAYRAGSMRPQDWPTAVC
jgi:hypothetical protein